MRYAHLWMSAELLFSATSYISDMVPGSFPAASFRGSPARSFLAGVLHAGKRRQAAKKKTTCGLIGETAKLISRPGLSTRRWRAAPREMSPAASRREISRDFQASACGLGRQSAHRFAR